MKRPKKSKKGFTLIELIVVVAILAILAAIAVPNFIGMTEKAKTATEVAAASEWANAINIHNTEAAGNTALTKVADGVLAAAPAIQASLVPVVDASITAPNTYVFPRITVAGGIASVTNKADIP